MIARDYVLVIEHGQWNRGDIYVTREAVRAFSAEDAKARWTCRTHAHVIGEGGKFIDNERLIDIEPYEETREDHRDIQHRDRAHR